MKSGSGSGRWENKYFSSLEPLDLSSKDLYRLKNINWTILLFLSFILSLSLSFFLSFVFFLSFFCFFRHSLTLLRFADLMNVTEEVTIHRPNVSTLLSSAFIKALERSVETLGLWIVTSSVTFFKSANQSSVKLVLIVHLVAVWTLIYSVSSVERAFDGHRFTLGLCSWGRRYIGPLLMYTSEPRWKTKGAFHDHPGHRRWFFSFLVNLHFVESRWTFSLLVVAQYVSWWHTSLLWKTS